MSVPTSSAGERVEIPDEVRLRDNRERSDRRAKAVLRRYHVYNALSEMITLTYADEPSIDAVSDHTELFLRRLRRSGLAGADQFPWTLVPEYGKRTGRLHLHMSIGWYRRQGCVEVCDLCALPGLRAKRPDIPPAGSACVGCIWGHGIVGRPKDGADAADARLTARYAAKTASYAGKGGVRVFGQKSYRRSQGFTPPDPVQDRYGSLHEATAALMALFDGEAPEWVGSMIDKGPVDVWSYRWGLTQ